MVGETDAQRQARWDADWQNALFGAKLGNPYATMCQRCCGRHKPPRDKECPNLPLGSGTAAQATK